jgi:hypothetical protein
MYHSAGELQPQKSPLQDGSLLGNNAANSDLYAIPGFGHNPPSIARRYPLSTGWAVLENQPGGVSLREMSSCHG